MGGFLAGLGVIVGTPLALYRTFSSKSSNLSRVCSFVVLIYPFFVKWVIEEGRSLDPFLHSFLGFFACFFAPVYLLSCWGAIMNVKDDPDGQWLDWAKIPLVPVGMAFLLAIFFKI
jgi:hypothetical protein